MNKFLEKPKSDNLYSIHTKAMASLHVDVVATVVEFLLYFGKQSCAASAQPRTFFLGLEKQEGHSIELRKKKKKHRKQSRASKERGWLSFPATSKAAAPGLL